MHSDAGKARAIQVMQISSVAPFAWGTLQGSPKSLPRAPERFPRIHWHARPADARLPLSLPTFAARFAARFTASGHAGHAGPGTPLRGRRRNPDPRKSTHSNAGQAHAVQVMQVHAIQSLMPLVVARCLCSQHAVTQAMQVHALQ